MKKILLSLILLISLLLRVYDTVSLPTSLTGILAIWLFYLFINNGLRGNTAKSSNIALTGSLVLAFNPWHVVLSRQNWEISLSLTATLAALVCLQQLTHKKNRRWFIGSMIVIILTLIILIIRGGFLGVLFPISSTLGTYFNHFSGRFLFIEGDWFNPGLGVIYHGLFYLVDAPLMVMGLLFVVKNGHKQFDRFMLIWLLLAPLPSVLTNQSFFSINSFTMVIPLVYFITIGIVSLSKLITNHGLLIASYCLLFTVYAFFFIRFADLYLIHSSILTARDHLVDQEIKYHDSKVAFRVVETK